MRINTKALFLCCQEEARIMIKQNHGKIINTASLAAKFGVPYLAHYSASKFAVLGLTYTMSKELGANNIKVNAVCPGLAVTDMKEEDWERRSRLFGISKEEMIERDKSRVPLGRFATPEDVADVFFFLSSEDSDYITGQSFNVDGGIENH